MSIMPNNTMPVPVEFEFQVKKDFHFLSAFAARFNTTIDMDRVYLPATLPTIL
jgi:hypothetical protein